MSFVGWTRSGPRIGLFSAANRLFAPRGPASGILWTYRIGDSHRREEEREWTNGLKISWQRRLMPTD